jgi:hypothetical protein
MVEQSTIKQGHYQNTNEIIALKSKNKYVSSHILLGTYSFVFGFLLMYIDSSLQTQYWLIFILLSL